MSAQFDQLQANSALQASLQFRPMQLTDLDVIMQIEPTIYSHPWTRGNFSDSINSGYSAWLLMQEKTMIGYALMMLVLDEAHLLNLSIAKNYQKLGFGKILLNKMCEIAKQHKAANMFLEVRASNIAAIKLYENVGFNEMSIRRNYYPAHGGREDAVLMGLAL